MPVPLAFDLNTRMWWYQHGDAPEIMIGDYQHEDGGCDSRGEFAIRWHTLGGENVPRLEMYDDSWLCLVDPQFASLAAWMADHADQNVTPDAVCAALESLGFTPHGMDAAPEWLLSRAREAVAKVEARAAELRAKLAEMEGRK